MSELTCHQPGCDSPPSHRYTWPGKDEQMICIICAMRLEAVAKAMGHHQQFIPLTINDYLREADDAPDSAGTCDEKGER